LADTDVTEHRRIPVEASGVHYNRRTCLGGRSDLRFSGRLKINVYGGTMKKTLEDRYDEMKKKYHKLQKIVKKLKTAENCPLCGAYLGDTSYYCLKDGQKIPRREGE
jgi:hypothetical protein